MGASHVSLLTTCPRCASQFRVRPEQLAAGGGWVQCGVCGAMFDARASLIPEEAPAVAAPVDEVLPPPSAPSPSLLETATDNSATPPALPEGPGEEGGEVPPGILSRQGGKSGAEELNSIILVDPDAPMPEEPESLPVILPPVKSSPAAPAVAAAPIPAAGVATDEVAVASAPPAPAAEVDLTAVAKAPRRTIWAILAALLLLVLAAQGAYFQRDALVRAVPALRPPFQQLCSWAGCRLALPHDIGSLAIMGSELNVSGRNTHAATLRVTLANEADGAEAWPNLRVTLQGLDGRARANVVLTPEKYLRDAAILGGGLPAQSQHTVRVELTVEGPPLLPSQPYSLEIFY